MERKITASADAVIGCLLFRDGALAGLATAAAAEADLLGEGRALRGVIWRHHWVIGRETPFDAVIVRRHAVGRAQMPFEHLQLLAVFQANQVFGRDRLADWDGRLERILLGIRVPVERSQ